MADKGAQVYTKDLTFLLRLLQSSKQSGTLFIEAFELNEARELPWQGQLQLENGAVISCVVRGKAYGNILFSHEEAIQWLIRQGKLEWRLEEGHQPASLLPPTLSQNERTREVSPSTEKTSLSFLWEKRRGEIFKRTAQGASAPAQAFPSRDHRQVFALIDGRRTAEEIMRLLHRSPEVVMQLLQELYAAGFIV